MGIDGIGKPPGAGGPVPPVGPSPAAPTGESFKVDKPSATEGAQATDALARLERGEIGVDAYLDARVTDAVQHLAGKLSSEQLEFVKSSLKEQLRTDPVLTELVRRATGG
jgi:hypothetical protein